MKRQLANITQPSGSGSRAAIAMVILSANGHIGYATFGAIPVRAWSAPEPNGNLAMPGTGEADDWQGFVPQDLLPHVVDFPSGPVNTAMWPPRKTWGCFW